MNSGVLERLEAFALRLTPARYRPFVRSSFMRQVAGTYATQIFIVALGFVNSILVTRLLGPVGKGHFTAANTFSGVGIQLGNLGLHSSNTYYVSRNPGLLPVLLGNSVLVSTACALATLAAYGVLVAQPQLAPVSGALLLLALAAVPIGLANLLFQNLLIGTQRIHTYNAIDLTTRVLAVLLVAATAPLGLVSPSLVFGVVQATVVLSMLWNYRTLAGALERPLAFSGRELRNGFGYGMRAYLGSLFAYLVLRSDNLLVTYLRGPEETGYYSIAAGLADILMMLPAVVGTVLFPRLAAAPTVREKWRLAWRVLSWMVPGTAVALLGTFLVAKPLIRLAYGPAFDPSHSAVVYLLPGIGFLAINTILMNLFASCGMPVVVVYSPAIALVVNVGLNLAFLPSYGFVAAAASSSAAYGLMLALSLVHLRRHILVPHA